MKSKNFELFVASRLNERGNASFISRIIRIAQVVIGICLAVMIIGSSIIGGFKSDITEKIFGFWGHIHLMDTRMNLNFDQIPLDKNLTFYPSLEEIDKIDYQIEEGGSTKVISTKGGIKKIQSFILFLGILQAEDQFEGLAFKGVDTDYDWDFLQTYIFDGKPLNLSDSIASRDLLISEQTAKRMKLSVGDPVIVHFVVKNNPIKRKFVVSGIYKTGLEEYDRKYALIDIDIIRDLFGWNEDQVGGFEIVLDNLDDIDIVNNYLYEEHLPNNIYSETLRQKAPQIFNWLDMQDVNEIVLIALMLVVALINMVTVILILILERSRMIGILKSLGARNWSIRKIFLLKAAKLIFWSLLIGNVVSLGLGFLQNKFKLIGLNEDDYYLSYVPIKFDFMWILYLNIGTVVTILVFLLIPTYLVSKINPVTTLRFR